MRKDDTLVVWRLDRLARSRKPADGLARALGAAHRRWANWVNARGRWRGHLFDGRFASVAMDEPHLLSPSATSA